MPKEGFKYDQRIVHPAARHTANSRSPLMPKHLSTRRQPKVRNLMVVPLLGLLVVPVVGNAARDGTVIWSQEFG